MFAVESFVYSRVEPEIGWHADLIRRGGEGEIPVTFEFGRRPDIARDGKAAAVPRVGAEVNRGADAITRKDIQRVALVVVAPEMRAGGCVGEPRVAERIGDPTGQAVVTAALDDRLQPARVAALRVGQNGTELRKEDGSISGQTELAGGGIDAVAFLTIVGFQAHP